MTNTIAHGGASRIGLGPRRRFFLALTLVTTSLPTLAAEQGTGLRAGALAIEPAVGLRFDYDSNIFDAASPEIDSWIAVLSPQVLLRLDPGAQQYELEYAGEYASFFDGSDDNYDDHAFSARGLFALGQRSRLNLSALYELGHNDRGDGLTRGVVPGSPLFPREPDEFDRSDWRARLSYGAEGARGRLDFEAGTTRLDYTNNRSRTAVYDHQTQLGSAALSIGLRERTAFVFEARFSDIIYEQERPGEPSREAKEWRYLVGVTWEATAQTEGTVRFGTQRRDFDDPRQSSSSRASWEASVRWSPRQYSHFDFTTTRQDEETVGEGAFVDSTSYGVAWTHEWARGFLSEAAWRYNDNDFVGTDRREELTEFGLGLRYPQGPRLLWDAGLTWRSRDSNVPSLEFDGLVFSIGVKFTI